jgi:hypothetical protein
VVRQEAALAKFYYVIRSATTRSILQSQAGYK